MDLLGDLGAADQLTSARTENAVLTAKVRELSMKVKELMVENQSLLAEVEMYRQEAALPNFSNLALGKASMDCDDDNNAPTDAFYKSGNGIYANETAVTLLKLHAANPLCCAFHPADDALLATGSASRELCLSQWGGAMSPAPAAMETVIKQAARIDCPGPVICVAFAHDKQQLPVVAAGCMDGNIVLAGFGTGIGGVGLQARTLTPSTDLKRAKYIKGLAWSPTAPILAAASADGTVLVLQVSNVTTSETVQVDVLQKLHLGGTPECLCFSSDGTQLILYTRDTPYLSFFKLDQGFAQTKINLNKATATGGFEEHVSFCVMDMAVSPSNNGQYYLALATDASRNIVLDITVPGKAPQIRNLYGHQNGAFANPKIAWSSSGQYVFGNTQEGGAVCVWDVASEEIVARLDGHGQPVRSLCSSRTSDALVTTSFDKQIKVWLVKQ